MISHAPRYRKALTTNATDTSFASKVATITEPTGAGVIDLIGNGIVVPSWMRILPYALGDDDDVFDLRLIGWGRIGALWIPTHIAQFTCTVSTKVGVSGQSVLDTERFADTIIIHATIAAQPRTTDVDSGGAAASGRIEIVSPANNLIGSIKLPLQDYEKVEFQFDMTTGDPTSANCLYALLQE